MNSNSSILDIITGGKPIDTTVEAGQSITDAILLAAIAVAALIVLYFILKKFS